MKRSAIIVVVLAMSLFACAQTPPKSVKDNFSSKLSGANKVKWDQEEANEWEAEFKMNGSEMSASFNNAGTWLETEKEIKEKELPVVVVNVLSDKYSGYKVGEVAEIQKPGFSGYEIDLEKGEEMLEIQVNPNGTIAQVKKVEEEDDED